jgi:hypothetical protein
VRGSRYGGKSQSEQMFSASTPEGDITYDGSATACIDSAPAVGEVLGDRSRRGSRLQARRGRVRRGHCSGSRASAPIIAPDRDRADPVAACETGSGAYPGRALYDRGVGICFPHHQHPALIFGSPPFAHKER